MNYTDKEIQNIHNKGYVQAMTHAIKMFREYPYLNALKIVQNLKEESEKSMSTVETDLNEIKYEMENA